jgi:hypothetical protein
MSTLRFPPQPMYVRPFPLSLRVPELSFDHENSKRMIMPMDNNPLKTPPTSPRANGNGKAPDAPKKPDRVMKHMLVDNNPLKTPPTSPRANGNGKAPDAPEKHRTRPMSMVNTPPRANGNGKAPDAPKKRQRMSNDESF